MTIGICERANCTGFVEISDQDQGKYSFCPECGGHLIYTCEKGHPVIKSDQKFCPECGVKLKKDSPPSRGFATI